MGKRIVDAEELIQSLDRRLSDILSRMRHILDSLDGMQDEDGSICEELQEKVCILEGQRRQIDETIQLGRDMAVDAPAPKKEKRGYWKVIPAKGFWQSARVVCSVCGYEDYHEPRCCPNCGSCNR